MSNSTVEFEFVALGSERVLDRIGSDHAIAADDGDALLVRRADPIDHLIALGARPEEHAEMQEIGERRAGADRLDAVDDDAFVVGRDHAEGRRRAVRARIRAIDLRVDEVRRAHEIVFHGVPIERPDVVREPAPVRADRVLLPGFRVVDIGHQDVVLNIGRARQRCRHEMLHDEFVILALADKLALAAVVEPSHRTPHALWVDEGQHVVKLGLVMQVEELGGALRVVAGRRVGRDVVDLLVADPDGATVVERFEILDPGPHRGVLPQDARFISS